MKIYKYQPPNLMRINIKKQGANTEHIAIEDAQQIQLINWIKNLIEKQGLSVFEIGKRTVVEVRESIKGENGVAISFSFKGLEPKQVAELIIKNLSI
tara:strand:- start:3020 stop:3310 length:291 start_codon:yes stop_codon:yes gene_type:complete